MTKSESFIEELVGAVPELTHAYKTHIADNDALLSHVFMGDVTRFVVDQANTGANRQAVQIILERLEAGLQAQDAQVRELILASFVENLLGENTALRALRPLMGLNLRRALREMGGT